MMHKVLLFAAAKDHAGSDSVELELPESATVADVRAALAARFPELADLLQRSMVAVDQQYANNERSVTLKSEIGLIPPVSGG